MVKVACNPFVYRQTPDSRFSHFQSLGGDEMQGWTELIALIERCMSDTARISLQHEGKVMSVDLPVKECPGQFFSGVILVDEKTELRAEFSKRAGALAGETAFVHCYAVEGKKAAAVAASAILYHHTRLSDEEKTYTPEGSDKPVRVEAEWQLISLNCRTTDAPEPPTPMAMARNFYAQLGLPEGAGGSPTTYTAEQFAEAIMYWSQRTMRK